jgi:hypothetical protein
MDMTVVNVGDTPVAIGIPRRSGATVFPDEQAANAGTISYGS